jgi:hypothetical protein
MRHHVLRFLFVTGLINAFCPASAVAEQPVSATQPASRPPTVVAGAGPRYEINLITMGPGEHLYTRAGHAALEVVTIRGKKRTSRVFNYGDADWQQAGLTWKFFRGTLMFRLSVAGTLEQVVAGYGQSQDRSIFKQRLALTDAQKQRLVALLERDLQPKNRYYPYHHIERICTTRIRDRLDDVLAGALKKQLDGRPHKKTIRDYQPVGFRGHHLAFLGGDLLIGRLHDRPISDYYALYIPQLMSEYLQQVDVVTADGKKVPLAGKPTVLYQRWKPPVLGEPGQTTSIFFLLMLVWLMLFIALAYLESGRKPPDAAKLARSAKLAGVGLLLPAIVLVFVSLAGWALQLLSVVPELHQNELLLFFWPTDVLLLLKAIQWLRGRHSTSRFFNAYLIAHIAVALIALLAHGIGVLYQRPLVVPVGATVWLLTAWVMTRRLSNVTVTMSTQQ